MNERSFLLLQGPPGPLFYRLACTLRERGASVHRINLSAGDWIDWPERTTNFRGSFTDWPVFLDRFLREQGITDLLLFGDCRPHHASAHRIAAMRGIQTHVLEEGYLRPNWVTLERDGVNGHSRLSRDPQWFRDEAAKLPPEEELPPITASFRRRVRDTAWYYTATHLGGWAFPSYLSHRPHSPLGEAFGWGWRYLTSKWRGRQATRILEALRGKPLYVLPLQLSGDYQIRAHSPFPDMPAAAAFILESFAAHAPADSHLIVKCHPLDASFVNWRWFLSRRATRLGVKDRVHFVDGGDLDQLAEEAAGMICVNSTSATLALAVGTPVCILGEAIYRMPGLTHEGHIDTFWRNPRPPAPGLYEAFRRVLVDRVLVRGGLASESAVNILVANLCERLLGQSDSSQASTAAKCAGQVGRSNEHNRVICAARAGLSGAA